MEKYYFIIILSVLFNFGCSKDENPINQNKTGAISGKVTDQTTGNPIAGVTVIIQQVSKTVITDNSGEYRITEIDAGNYSLTATKDGYISSNVNIKIIANQTTNVSFALSTLPAEPSDPKVYINLFQHKDIIDTAQIQITVIDTSEIQEVLFFVDGTPVLSFNQKNISFVWELPAFEDGSSHQIYCTAKNVYNKVDSTEIFNVTTYKLDTVAINNITASEDSILVEWNYLKEHYDSFHTSLTITNNNSLVFSETKSVTEMNAVFKDSLNDFYDYTLLVATKFKGYTATKFVTKNIELNPTPKIDSLVAPNRIHPATVSHIKVTVKVTSKDLLNNISNVHLYFYRPDSSYVRLNMWTFDLNLVTGIYTCLIPAGPGYVPVLGNYRLEVEAIHNNGRKSRRIIKAIYLG